MTAIKSFAYESFRVPKPITSEAQNELYTKELMALESKKHMTAEERAFARLLILLIEDFEKRHYAAADASPQEVLIELMNANALRQKDLVPYIGPESMVSMVLSGQRPLTKKHIEKLSKRFNVSPELFF